MAMTPMMEQYCQIKEKYPEAILFFRLGDFYEMFFEDAKIASRELELVLTGKDCGLQERAPMCGVPFHSADSYIARLVQRGYKVAVCEQIEDPATAKTIVKRDVVRIVSPATVIETSMLDEAKNNYLAAVYCSSAAYGLCFADISTSKVYCCELSGKNSSDKLKNELASFMPSELIVADETVEAAGLESFLEIYSEISRVKPLDLYDTDRAIALVEAHFGRPHTQVLGQDRPLAVCALALALDYLVQMHKNDLKNITEVELYNDTKYMGLDAAARRNLELTETMRRRETRGSLLWVLDMTNTPMGKRMLRSWVEQPLLGVSDILLRQNAVAELTEDIQLLDEISEGLKSINDFERIMTRVIYGSANAKEIKSLARTFSALPEIKSRLEGRHSKLLNTIYSRLDTMQDAVELIDAAIVEDPPFSVREGGMINKGYNSELDELLEIVCGGKDFLASLELAEQERTGIKKLKIGYNRVFGYYIEVTNSFKSMVPEAYIRKQTLANCERYITSELKELESKVLGAQERIVRLEYELLCAVRQRLSDMQYRIKNTANSIAVLDCICSLAQAAVKNGYERPEITADDEIVINDGRHPVVEKFLKDTPFVPNSTRLDCKEDRVAIITGPNMAGKSTYMRQVALIVIMAQIGSFVPARSARIGIVDSVFTRIGASDDLTAGQSTFMTEMTEVADILRNATARSLILLDEIGRGTSTYDGMSIARAVMEYSADRRRLGAKTLFATHYHELTELEGKLDGAKNFNIAVKKRGDDIIFLRKIVRGTADGSYGIEVAKLAGIPQSVVSRARAVLKELESAQPLQKPVMTKAPDSIDEQISFATGINADIANELRSVDANTLSPIEALNLVYKLKAKLD